MEKTSDNILKFTQLSTSIDPGFWYKLSELKLDVDRLDEYERMIWGSYKNLGDRPVCEVNLSSFNKSISIPTNCNYSNVARGYCINKNTVESYKECDKSELASKYGHRLKTQMSNGEVLDDPSLLSSFILLTHADLKRFNFIYWFAFLVPQDISVKVIEPQRSLDNEFSPEMIKELFKSHSQLNIINRTYFVLEKVNNGIKVLTLKEFSSSLKNAESDVLRYYFGFCDSTKANSQNPSWYLRNYLAFIHLQFSHLANDPINVICIQGMDNGYILRVTVEGDKKLEKWIGWKKSSDGKFRPRSVNLGDSMDPVRLAENGKRLNLSLMKWRLAPDLNLDIVKNTRFLLLGSGTLGCSVALNLTAWGVERIMFVDSGRVSYSNPARQFLFSFEDSRNNVHKAQAAAKRLKCICPNMIVDGKVLEIPMPGHSTGDIPFKLDESTVYPSEYLSKLISEHDIIFLLTDTRESRWLPTVLARHHKKIAITAALGFDSYLVMRHGMHDSKKPLGCYFCNDVTAPGNSTADRTLDQQCTVTRPGVASLAAALAVELAVSILQHPERGAVQPTDETVLGAVPHSIRGYLSSFNQILPSTPAFESCVACSTKVLSEYEKEKRNFLLKVYESTSYLENLTGISELLNDPNIDEIVELDGEEDF